MSSALNEASLTPAMPTTVDAALRAEHARLDELFDELMAAAHAGDAAGLDARWTTFERTLLAHLEWEEAHLLPAFDAASTEQAAAIRADHARFRGLLSEMGVGVELHTVREETIREFVALLRTHAKREENMYRWAASRALPEPATRSLLDRVRALLARR